MTAIRTVLVNATLLGDPVAPTPAPGDSDQSVATTGFVASAIAVQNIRGLTMGKGGSILTTDTNAADYPISVPFDCTLLRMKAIVKSAVSGAMTVQLRRAAAPITTPPSYSDVAGFSVTFVNGQVYAKADPVDVDVNEDDVLNFSCTTGSGSNILVELVTALR